jgi:hypothetical protein
MSSEEHSSESLYRRFVSIADCMNNECSMDEYKINWDGSPFKWIYILPESSKGPLLEKIFRYFLTAIGFNVENRTDSEHDMIVNGMRVELKSAFASGRINGDRLLWAHIKQNYDVLILLGIFPHKILMWVFDVDDFFNSGELGTQKYLDNDGAKLAIIAQDVPEWMTHHGGELEIGIKMAREKLNGSIYQCELELDETW